MESIRGYDKWLTTPPDDDPICEGEHGCGEYMVRDAWTHDWVCVNAFCPEKFQGTEQKMAEALVEALDSSRTYKDRYEQMKRSRDEAERKLEKSRREVADLVEIYSNLGLE